MASTAPPSTLAQLLQQSQHLTNVQGHSDVPTLQLGLDQIESQSRRLAQASSSAAPRPENDVSARAEYLLANGGVDAAELAQTIQNTRIANAFEPLRPLDDTDVAGYLRHEHEQVVLSCLVEGRRNTEDAFYRSIDSSLNNSWDAQKRRIVEDFGSFVAPSAPIARNSTLRPLTATAAANAPTFTPLQMHSKMYRYAKIVDQLNEARLKGELFPLAHTYGHAIAALVHSTGQTGLTKQIEAWNIVQAIVGEHDVVHGTFTRGAIAAREYASSYLDPRVYFGSSNGLDLRKKLRAGSMHYLEQAYLDHIDRAIQSNPTKAQVGGQPTVRNRALAYCRVTHLGPDGQWSSELETLSTNNGGKVPIWAYIYYLVRTGYTEDALIVAREHEQLIRRTDQSFVGTFKTWLDSPDHTLPKTLHERLFTEYNARFRLTQGTVDPYKLTLFRIMGRIERRKRFPRNVTHSSDDWLWLQLSLVTEPTLAEGDVSTDDLGRDTYSLADVALTVVDFGPGHFNPQQNKPYAYFNLLLLVGQFERAVAFLHSRATARADAVQFAIALTYYGLLRVPPQAKASQLDFLTYESLDADLSLAGTPPPLPVAYLDFARLIARYIRAFVETDPQVAMHHVYLIALNGDAAPPLGQEQLSTSLTLAQQVVLDSKDYYTLLGDPRNDGSISPGTITKYSPLLGFANDVQFIASIVGAAADVAEQTSQIKDAILLYNLAGEYEKVVAVLNNALGTHLMDADSTSGRSIGTGVFALGTSLQAAQDIPTIAYEILATYERQAHVQRKISPARRHTLRLLLELKHAVAAYHANQLDTALGIIEATDLIPLKADVMAVTRKAEEWKEVNQALSKNIPELLLLTMTILSQLHAQLRTSLYSDPSRQRTVSELRSKARTLLSYAGLLRYRLSSDVYSRMLSLAPQ